MLGHDRKFGDGSTGNQLGNPILPVNASGNFVSFLVSPQLLLTGPKPHACRETENQHVWGFTTRSVCTLVDQGFGRETVLALESRARVNTGQGALLVLELRDVPGLGFRSRLGY